MSVSFLSPLAALLVLAAGLAPLAALGVTESRARRLRSVLGLPEPSLWGRAPLASALVVVAGLLALAAAQPVLSSVRTRHVRADAQAWFVFDTSRSMLAARSADAGTRFDRAQAAALQVRAALAEVPVGIASITNRALPHLFPTTDSRAFGATVERAVGIEKPPPDATAFNQVTTFAALSGLATRNFFSPSATRRLAVVFTDGESRPFLPEPLGRLFRRKPGIEAIFVRFWHRDERVFTDRGVPEAYRPDQASGRALDKLAAALGGRTFSESELGAAARAARGFLGSGPEVAQGQERTVAALAPYAILAAFVPLGFLLRRRNF